MIRINYNIAGRLNLIVNPDMIYITIWWWGERYHWCKMKKGKWVAQHGDFFSKSFKEKVLGWQRD